VDAVQEAHIGKNKKCGILPFVQDFEDFVELAESIFRDSERRTDIDKAYKTLIEAVFEASAYDIIAAVFGICFNLRFSSREFSKMMLVEQHRFLLATLWILRPAVL